MDDEKEFLQFLENYDKVSISFMRQEYENMKRQKILDQTKIWLADDGRWKAYVDVAGKRRLIAKRVRADLEDAIIDTYKDPKIKFKECFDGWLTEKSDYGEIQRQTYDKYRNDYIRFFKGTDLEYKEVKKIDELYLESFIKSSIHEKNLTAKAYSNMRTLINGAMIYARKHGYTDMRISLFFSELNLSSKIFAKRIVLDKEQVFRRDEEVKIEDYIADNPDIRLFGVALAFHTGLRVGEVAALKWSDYQGDILLVNKTEVKYKGERGEYVTEVQNYTKGRDGHREVVLNDSARTILERLYKLTGGNEWMFTRDGERMKAFHFQNKMRVLNKTLNMPQRSFHKIRKTYATKLEAAGVSDPVIIQQMGHTEILTTKKHYIYNNEQIAEIKDKLNKV